MKCIFIRHLKNKKNKNQLLQKASKAADPPLTLFCHADSLTASHRVPEHLQKQTVLAPPHPPVLAAALPLTCGAPKQTPSAWRSPPCPRHRRRRSDAQPRLFTPSVWAGWHLTLVSPQRERYHFCFLFFYCASFSCVCKKHLSKGYTVNMFFFKPRPSFAFCCVTAAC